MSLGDELRDPWALVAAGIAGGAAWAVGIPVVAAVGVGAVVLGVKAGIGALVRRGPRRPKLPIRDQSPEQRWLRRAQRAVESLTDLASSAPAEGAVAERCRTVAEQASGALDSLRRLGGRVSAVAAALRHVDVARLASEEQRLAAEHGAASDAPVQSEIGRALESVRSQLAVHERLRQAERSLLARMESTAIGLEGLVASVAEVLALADSASSPAEGAQQIDALAEQLEGLRSGLAETEDLSVRALEGVQGVEGLAEGGPSSLPGQRHEKELSGLPGQDSVTTREPTGEWRGRSFRRLPGPRERG